MENCLHIPRIRSAISTESVSEEEFDFDSSDDEPDIGMTSRKSAYEKQTTKELYLKVCSSCGAMPVPQFYKHSEDKKIRLNNCSIGDIGMRPLAVALVNDINIQDIDLEDNGLSSLGCSYIAEMLTENVHITHLNLAENCLGSHGARIFRDVMLKNGTITHLNLSGNGFNENDAIFFSEILEKNRELKDLNLSHNAFSEVGGQLLYQGIVENNTLEVLDLGWNHLRKMGAIAVSKALKLNSGLLKVNLEWNGFGPEGALSLGLAIAENGRLEELNLNANRITKEGIGLFLQGLVKNTTLKSLKLRNNPILKYGATALLRLLVASENIRLEHVDIADVTVDDEFMETLQKVREQRPDINIIFGKILSQKDPVKKIYQIVNTPEDAIMILFEQIKFNGFRLIDYFKQIDKDKNFEITKEELRDGLVELDPDHNVSIHTVDQIMNELDADQNGCITFEELIAAQKSYIKRLARRRVMEKKHADAQETDEEKIDGVRVKIKNIMEQRGADSFGNSDLLSVYSPTLRPITPQMRRRTPSARARTPRL